MPAAQGIDAEAEPLQRRRPYIGDEDVGRREQPVQRVAAFLALEIEDERALVAVEVHELARQLSTVGLAADRAQQVAAGGLDLDDIGTVVGEIERCGGPDHDSGEIDHAYARKRSSTHRAPPPIMHRHS